MSVQDFKKIENKFRQFDGLKNKDVIEEKVLDAFILQLNESNLDSYSAFKIKVYRRLISIFSFFAGLVFIVLGLALIIIPIPKAFEIKTIFYFNPQDGLTISDLFALAAILLGNLFIYNTFKK